MEKIYKLTLFIESENDIMLFYSKFRPKR